MKSNFTEIYRQFTQSLVTARQQKSLTQDELARILGKPQSFVSKFENGQRRLDVVELIEIASVLDLDAGELMSQIQKQVRKKQAKR